MALIKCWSKTWIWYLFLFMETFWTIDCLAASSLYGYSKRNCFTYDAFKKITNFPAFDFLAVIAALYVAMSVCLSVRPCQRVSRSPDHQYILRFCFNKVSNAYKSTHSNKTIAATSQSCDFFREIEKLPQMTLLVSKLFFTLTLNCNFFNFLVSKCLLYRFSLSFLW